MECVICGKSLTGGSDTFGPRGVESCRSCWLEYGISGPYDPWEQLNIACGTKVDDVRYLNAAAENKTITLPSSRTLTNTPAPADTH